MSRKTQKLTKMKMIKHQHILHSLFLLFFLVKVSGAGDNPFSPRAHLIRYWSNKIHNAPRPEFLFSKASPLTAADSARFAQLATQNALSTHLDSFCRDADILCHSNDLASPTFAKESTTDAGEQFDTYGDRNFTTYGADHAGGNDSFTSYSDNTHVNNIPVNTFRSYSKDSAGHGDKFSAYVTQGNYVTQKFSAYGDGAKGGAGDFQNYADMVNAVDLEFTSYSADGKGRQQSFDSYTTMTNVGGENFGSYGKRGKSLTNSFKSYGNSGNVVGSGFSSYSDHVVSGTDNFTSYGDGQNVPQNEFKNYGRGGKRINENFASYRDQANTGSDSFQSYAKNSTTAKVKFSDYGQSLGNGTDKFSGYGNGAKGQAVDFTTYAFNTTFSSYTRDKSGVKFSHYTNTTDEIQIHSKTAQTKVEPGKFFREEKLKTGTIIPMPDIKDKMPKRSFLPRSIVSKLPFSTKIKGIFSSFDVSSLNAALQECERAPSLRETKRCVGSAEDMIDFVVSVMGDSVELRSTESTQGSKRDVMIGRVRGINGGKVTQSVSCHQSLYPYLLYYCHAVPKVRVYEADILDPKSKGKINRGVAICHLDTSAWSPTHGAFSALGSGPGKIEVCHWIFENDMTWTIVD